MSTEKGPSPQPTEDDLLADIPQPDKYAIDSMRNIAADSIVDFRNIFRGKDMSVLERLKINETRNHTAKEYRQLLGGFDELFKYVQTLPSKTIVDAGTGNGFALALISENNRYSLQNKYDLEFIGTDLIKAPLLNPYKFRQTSIESMKGFSNESVGAIISVLGAYAYTQAPQLAVENTDRILVPGGILKIVIHDFPKKQSIEEVDSALKLLFESLAGYFKYLGYDLSAQRCKQPQTEKDDKQTFIRLLAVKPLGDGTFPIQADELMKKDLETLKSI